MRLLTRTENTCKTRSIVFCTENKQIKQIKGVEPALAEQLKIIPLGGLNEIGKNMTVYEYGGEIIVVDCGMAFPGDDMYGIDCVIPDVSYLVKHKNRIRGMFITHGHEDHIGAVPYILKKVNIPIYCTRLTAGLIRLKLEEHGLLKSTKIVTVESGMTVKAGKFSVEFIHVNHSIADSVAFAIHTGLGTVVHTGDFKIDSTPIDGEVIDLARFGELGKQGVLALLADSTNVERPGYTMSERTVGRTFNRLFQGCKQRIIVTTFASNVHRIQQIMDAAAECGRKVAVTGRSMENVTKVAMDLGYMKPPKNTVVDINKIKSMPLEKQVIVTTGSQGEEMSALYRMAFSQHKQIEVGPGDRVIISASAIATGVLALVIVFQPELRRMLEHVAQTKLNKLNIFQSSQDKDSELTGVWNESISVIANACETLSKTKTGALIVFERQTKLGEIIKTGTVVDATPSNELIGNLFFVNSPLHDGAMIIRDGRICASGCFLPLSQNYTISKEMGTRHRAALGVSENSDAVVVVVSEETGTISIAEGGVIERNFTIPQLEKRLRHEILHKNEEGQRKQSSVKALLRKVKK